MAVRRLLIVGATALAVAGCGDAKVPTAAQPTPVASQATPRSVSLAEIEAQNAAARRRARTKARRRASRDAPPAATPEPSAAAKPPIVRRLIPFTATRKQQMAAYAQRHYGIDTYRLEAPKVIVEHVTVTSDAQGAIDIFTPDVADTELHELPGVCSHFVVDRDGTIYQLVPLSIMCRHTVGLNYTAIGIEHAGFSDRQVLTNPRQMASSLALTRWLRFRYRIPTSDVIGHNESLSSPYHRERVASLRHQTHADWSKADMDTYRRRLATGGF